MDWTVEKVKQDLPPVTVKLESGKIVAGTVSGRRNKYPTVHTKCNQTGWEFGWGTVVRALNNNRPLKV